MQERACKMKICLLKTLIVGTRQNRLAEEVLTSTHNLCFGQKIRKIVGMSTNIRIFEYSHFIRIFKCDFLILENTRIGLNL